MAKTEITKSNGGQLQRPTDFLSAMRTEMDRVFERFEQGWSRWPSVLRRGLDQSAMVPDLDVHENGKQFTIECDLPGVDEKDVTVTLANGMLKIKGEKKTEREEKKEDYYMAERSYGAFERMIQLPDSVDDAKLEAKFDKGVLKVIAQKRPEAVKAERKIEIKKA